MTFRRLLPFIGLGVLAAILSWLWLGSRPVASAAFRTVPVVRGDLQVTVSATGTIEPEEVVDVGAQVVGMIREFGRDPDHPERPVDYGSRVDVGTVLAQIDDTLYRAQLDQARANAERARADLLELDAKLRKADRAWVRAQDLRSKGVISDADYDIALADYDTARSELGVGKASIVQADATLHQAEINLGYTTIRSPVKGVVVDRRVNIGQTVVSSLNAPSLFLLAKDLTRVQIWASVNEADIGRIEPGQAVRFTVDAFPRETFVGEVAQVRLNATMTQNVVTYTVVVTVDNPDARLLPYLTTSLKFDVDRRAGVMLVPNAALRWQPDPEQVAPDARGTLVPGGSEPSPRGSVWVTEGRFVRPVAVQVGPSDGVTTEIASTDVHEGEPVVVGEIAAAEGEGEVSPFAPRLFGGGRR
ncbi:MAG TPA: efflux RND transporter periplasmic adaptor subunit [Candidatus Eisenbacteria bacterium]|nr:efflux RND transporter periplasmic adaptor subunit [Candidatus Eisenbacteria bacterium]